MLFRKCAILAMLLLFTFGVVAQRTGFAQNDGSRYQKQMEQLLKRFPNSDTNGDGKLSREEAMAFRDKFMEQQQAKKANAKNFADKPQKGKDATHPLLAYGPHKRNFLHLWLPVTKKPAPLVLHIHGGGFRNGDITKDTKSTIAEAYNNLGVAYADVEYRLLDEAELPEILRDCARAVQFLRYNAKKYHLDKKRVAAFGGSAGAGTSFWLATHDDLADPKAEDPVLRESTRLIAAGGNGVQATYDILQWPKIMGLSDNPNKAPNYSNALARFNAIDKKQGMALRKDLDMLGNLDPKDPPLHFSEGSNDLGVHSHVFPEAIKAKADRIGVPCTITNDKDSLQSFMLKHLGVSGAKATGGRKSKAGEK